MALAKTGDRVRIHYIGSYEDGTNFASTYKKKEPLEFTIGEKKAITGIEKAVIGMEKGDTKKVTISPEDSFGEYKDELVFEINKSKFPSHIVPHQGMELNLTLRNGGTVKVLITDIGEETVTLNGNHPLAGKVLHFEIKLIEIL